LTAAGPARHACEAPREPVQPNSNGITGTVDTDLKKVKVAHIRLVTECMVPELIPVLGSQPAGDVSHKHDSRLQLLSARPAVTLTTLQRAATNFAAW